jgi:dTMP kinase
MQSFDAERGRDLIRRGPFARLWWSQVVSSIGDWVALFASLALAARIAGGGSEAAVAALVPLMGRILPGLVFGFVGGVIADRWSRKTTLVVADFGRAAMAVGLLFVGTYPQLFAVTFISEIFALIRQPAREAVVPTLVSKQRLLTVNGLNLIAAYGTAPLGSALYAAAAEVGELLPAFGRVGPAIGTAFVFDALTFVVSGFIVVTIPIPSVRERMAAALADGAEKKTALADIWEGMTFVLRSGPVRRMIGGMAAGLFGGGALIILGQPFSEQVLRGGESGYGVLVTALGVGVGLGMLGVTIFASMETRREPVFGFSLGATGVAISLAAFTDTVFGAAGWGFLAGCGTGIAYVTGFTHLHATVSDDVRGRTFAAMFAFARTALLVSLALAGVGAVALAGVFPGELNNGIRAVMLIGGVIVALSGLMVLIGSGTLRLTMDEDKLRRMDDAADSITWMRGSRRRKDD